MAKENIYSVGEGSLKEALFYEKLDNKLLRCQICFRSCIVLPGERGFCLNRENIDGHFYNLVYGRPSAVQVDPVEKEPLYHFKPGTSILSIGTAGCNFRCRFCHNWQLSQKSIEDMYSYQFSPQDAVEKAKELDIPTISFTYNEPAACYEYVHDTAVLAQEKGIRIVFHSNGALKPEPLRGLLKYIDAVTIDFKSFSEEFYRKISQGSLETVLQSLKIIKNEGVWLEIVNLVIPQLNDSEEELKGMCAWIRENLGSEVPLHFSRYFPSYKLTNLPPTPISTLERAFDTANQEGLKFVTLGNVPGHKKNKTFCPKCDNTLVDREHFEVLEINIIEGACSYCRTSVPGVWE